MNTSTANAITVHSQAIENENAKVRIVAKPKSKLVTISMSENQIEAMDTAAKNQGMNRSEYVRWLLAQADNNFPDDLPAHGENLKSDKNTN